MGVEKIVKWQCRRHLKWWGPGCYIQHGEDIPIWKHNRNGIYSAKSAYYHLKEVIIDNNHLKVEGNWKKLWKLCIPKKV
jgi:hypothetical protein